MATYYKNVLKKELSAKLFGYGVVTIPANATCVELADDVAAAFNSMVAPKVVLEKVTVDIKPEA